MRPISDRTKLCVENFIRRYLGASCGSNCKYSECKFAVASVTVPFYPDRDINLVPTFISQEVFRYAFHNSSTEIIIPLAEHGTKSFATFHSYISWRELRYNSYLWKILIKDNIYYIKPGLILDINYTPLLITMINMKVSGGYCTKSIMIHPKVFTQDGPVEKGIINTIIPVVINSDCNKVIISKDIETFIQKSNKPWKDMNKDIREFLRSVTKETLDKVFIAQ